MNYIKCPKCGKEEPAFDYAHVCGPVQLKKPFNKLLREFEQESKLEIFGLGARREIWEQALEKYAELIVKKTLDEVAMRAYVCGDRAWSDDVDRQWVELEFGLGKLAELKNERY